MTTAESSFYTRPLEERQIDEALHSFKKITRRYALFHILFFIIAVLELCSFILFFSFLTRSTVLAFSLAAIFFTGFTYFILLFYLQAKKPEQLVELRNAILKACDSSSPESPAEKYLKRSHTLQKFFAALHRQEYNYYRLPSTFQTLSPLMEKFSAWTHWKDLHQMREILLLMIIRQQIELVKLHPTDLKTHAHLADAYIALAHLYTDPRKQNPNEEHAWISPEYYSKEMQISFEQAIRQAIEEFKILDHFAPGDLWIHAQLASLYKQLGQSEEEMRTYEAILRLSPSDAEVLLRLGILYFEQGLSAQALRLYEQLKAIQHPKANELIAHYGNPFGPLFTDGT